MSVAQIRASGMCFAKQVARIAAARSDVGDAQRRDSPPVAEAGSCAA